MNLFKKSFCALLIFSIMLFSQYSFAYFRDDARLEITHNYKTHIENETVDLVNNYPGEEIVLKNYEKTKSDKYEVESYNPSSITIDGSTAIYRAEITYKSKDIGQPKPSTPPTNTGGDAVIYIKYESKAGHNLLYNQYSEMRGKDGEVLDLKNYVVDIKLFKHIGFNPSNGLVKFDAKRRNTGVIIYEHSNTSTTNKSQEKQNQTNQQNQLQQQKEVKPINSPVIKKGNIKFIGGYPDGSMKPKNPVKREEVASIFMKILDEDFTKNISKSATISDVKSEAWSYEAVMTMVSSGFMKNQSGNNFNPRANATRGEIALILANFVKDEDAGEGQSFRDINQNEIAEAVKKVTGVGLMNGYPDGTFKPNDPVTRAQLIVVINKLLGKNISTTNQLTKFTDVKETDWYYVDIQLAVQGS